MHARTTKALAAAGALGVALAFGSIPFLFVQSQVKLQDKKRGLTGSQVQRGAFLNSGSKDVGIDPDWDRRTWTWRGGERAGGASDGSE